MLTERKGIAMLQRDCRCVCSGRITLRKLLVAILLLGLWASAGAQSKTHDLKLVPHKDPGHGPRGTRDGGETAAVLINATLKGTYAPVALPTREFMEHARVLWERLGLPPLKPESPWHGYELGHWPPALAREAKLATDGDYFKTGAEAEKHRRSDIIMNTPIDRSDKK